MTDQKQQAHNGKGHGNHHNNTKAHHYGMVHLVIVRKHPWA